METYLEPTGDIKSLSVHEQQVILAAEYIHHVYNKKVTVGTIADYAEISPTIVSDVLENAEVRDALAMRGIPANSTVNVPERQLSFLLCMFNPLDTRSHRQIMSDLGITLSEFYGWNKDPQFKALMDRVAHDFFTSTGIFVDRELTRRALSGNVPAMRLYYDQKAQSTMSPQLIIQRVVDVVQKYIRDPEVQRQIASELLSTTKLVKGEVNA